MSHKNVLKRAWEILWQYKALWVFGLILALTTASYSPQSNYQFNRGDFQGQQSLHPGARQMKSFRRRRALPRGL